MLTWVPPLSIWSLPNSSITDPSPMELLMRLQVVWKQVTIPKYYHQKMNFISTFCSPKMTWMPIFRSAPHSRGRSPEILCVRLCRSWVARSTLLMKSCLRHELWKSNHIITFTRRAKKYLLKKVKPKMTNNMYYAKVQQRKLVSHAIRDLKKGN